MTCERCGQELVIGAWPFCPHGKPSYVAESDEIPGGFVQEHFGHEPEVFYSKSAMLRRAKELGLEPMVRWAGPHDKHVSRWDAVDAYTLKNAEELVARVAEGRRPSVAVDAA